jgi:carboxylate/amino acid/amine transporter
MLYLFVVSMLWAFSFGLIKGILTGIDSTFVATARLLLSLLVFLPFIRFRGIGRKRILQLMFIGMLQYGVMYITYIHSFRYLQAYEVALFTIFTPIYVTLVNDFLQRRFSWFNLLTALLAVFGTGIVVGSRLSQNEILFGFIILQVSNVCFAFGQVYYRKVMGDHSGLDDKKVFGLLYLGGFLAAALFSVFVTSWEALILSSSQVMTLIYLGVVASGLGFFLWNYGARRTNVGALAIFNNLKVPLAIVVSLLFFGESAHVPDLILGGFLVIAALVINEWGIRTQFSTRWPGLQIKKDSR